MMERDREHPLSGWIQLDDAYLGGERSGGKRGRGAPGKTPFVAAVETNEHGRPLRIEAHRRWRASDHHRNRRLRRSSTSVQALASSPMGWPAFMASPRRAAFMSRWWWASSGEPLSSAPSSRCEVNTILGNIKNALRGTYHATPSQVCSGDISRSSKVPFQSFASTCLTSSRDLSTWRSGRRRCRNGYSSYA